VTPGPRPASRPLAPGAVLYFCRITHTRLAPLRNAFTYSTYLWLVDLDHLPRPGPARGCGCWPASLPATTWATRAGRSGTTSTSSCGRRASTWPAAEC
jgi:Protein of unknown function (DUF1365)